MSETQAKRIQLLHPIVREQCLELLSRCTQQGIELLVTQTFRTFAEQQKLFAQGRTTEGPKVTNAPPGMSWHNWGLAFDVAIRKYPNDLTPNDVYDGPWDVVGKIGEHLGLEWGGRWWKPNDRTHFQSKLGWSINGLLTAYPNGPVGATWPLSGPVGG